MNSNSVSTKLDVIGLAKLAWSNVSGVKTPIMLAVLFCVVLQAILQGVVGGISIAIFGELLGKLLLGVVVILVLSPAYAGLLYMGLQRVRGLPVMFNQVWYGYQKDFLVNIWVFNVILNLAIYVIGFIVYALSLVPVIGGLVAFAGLLGVCYLLIRLSFGLYFIFDKNMTAVDALKHSYRVTGSYIWSLVLAFILAMIAGMVGFFALLIGLIWAIPFMYIYFGSLYQAVSQERIA